MTHRWVISFVGKLKKMGIDSNSLLNFEILMDIACESKVIYKVSLISRDVPFNLNDLSSCLTIMIILSEKEY